ncbi:hypothetical protein ACFSUR_14315 [Halalkalibacter alkalisediminis]|uniref:Uncharacterized protein n=2 Tax=Halalkalibacter alkalisediminis TaxID=935616 RepID=A0ABV6NJP9_9BACI|nr:hypothetical protein [Halalkalibacter alkalisediminis]
MSYQKPLKAHLIIEEISNKSKEIDVHTMDSFGLSFSTDLDFPSKEETSLTLKIKFFALGEVTGEVIRKEMGYDGRYVYELKALSCNLQYLKTCAPLYEAPTDRFLLS